VYVDDLIIIADTEHMIDGFLEELSNDFPKLSIHRGRRLNYVGVTIDFSVAGEATVTMANFITELLKDMDDKVGFGGIALTPATALLFEVKESPLLPDKEREFFHSTAAKLLYMAKRARPELLTVVAFLTTRVLAPTVADQDKLKQAIKYIRGTPLLGLRLTCDEPLSIKSYVDASYGTNNDYKSQTGVALTLGQGAVYAASTKQKIVVKSSTEAELVGISDALGQVIGLRNFIMELGYDLGPARVMQDNKATMAMVSNGRSTSSRTRHISIRYFFVADRVKSGEVVLEWASTTDMVSDMLTKPIVGAEHAVHRGRLLGHSS
jgi:hypothetical protein